MEFEDEFINPTQNSSESKSIRITLSKKKEDVSLIFFIYIYF